MRVGDLRALIVGRADNHDLRLVVNGVELADATYMRHVGINETRLIWGADIPEPKPAPEEPSALRPGAEGRPLGREE